MMNISTLDSERLYNSFVSGAQEVIKNKNSLNEINVFPVADGDTGSNLSSTMHAIIRGGENLRIRQGNDEQHSRCRIDGCQGQFRHHHCPIHQWDFSQPDG